MNSLAYPADAPGLQTGKDYLLVVTDETTGKDSNADPNKGLGFQLINSDMRRVLAEQYTAITKIESLDQTAQKLVLAMVYSQAKVNGWGILGEAQKLLAEVAQSLNRMHLLCSCIWELY